MARNSHLDSSKLPLGFSMTMESGQRPVLLQFMDISPPFITFSNSRGVRYHKWSKLGNTFLFDAGLGDTHIPVLSRSLYILHRVSIFHYPPSPPPKIIFFPSRGSPRFHLQVSLLVICLPLYFTLITSISPFLPSFFLFFLIFLSFPSHSPPTPK